MPKIPYEDVGFNSSHYIVFEKRDGEYPLSWISANLGDKSTMISGDAISVWGGEIDNGAASPNGVIYDDHNAVVQDTVNSLLSKDDRVYLVVSHIQTPEGGFGPGITVIRTNTKNNAALIITDGETIKSIPWMDLYHEGWTRYGLNDLLTFRGDRSPFEDQLLEDAKSVDSVDKEYLEYWSLFECYFGVSSDFLPNETNSEWLCLSRGEDHNYVGIWGSRGRLQDARQAFVEAAKKHNVVLFEGPPFIDITEDSDWLPLSDSWTRLA
ncbi:MAG: hypothetical protein ABFD64_10280 [Armatimonadota bacterium]